MHYGKHFNPLPISGAIFTLIRLKGKTDKKSVIQSIIDDSPEEQAAAFTEAINKFNYLTFS